MNKRKLIVSLTSYPNRIQTVHKAIESLFAQSQKADEIILWLSTQEFEKREMDIPENLRNLIGLNGFRIEWVSDNLKSHKKYFYALAKNAGNIIITVDDDMYYEKDMICTLLDSWKKHPYAISARRVHLMFRNDNVMAEYNSWEPDIKEYIGKERMDLCAVGCCGILYPPNCAKKGWFDRETIKQIAMNQDDLWLKYNELIDGIPVVYTSTYGQDIIIEESQANALYFENAYGAGNDICIRQLVQLMREKYTEVYYGWFHGLKDIKNFWAVKKKYYLLELEKLFTYYEDLNFYICGGGKFACVLIKFLKTFGKQSYIKAFLVSDHTQNKTTIEHIPVKQIKNLNEKKPYVVFCGVSEKYKEELKRIVKKDILCRWVEIDIPGIIRLTQFEQTYQN